MRHRLPGAALAVLLAAAGSAQVSRPHPGSPAHREAREAMALVRSPFFVGHTLDMCPNPGADVLRDSVYLAAAAGMPSEQIIEDFIARHGEHLRLLPRGSGFGLWAWLAPPAVLFLGLLFIAGRLRRMRGRVPPAPQRNLTDDERLQLEAALRGFDAEGAGA